MQEMETVKSEKHLLRKDKAEMDITYQKKKTDPNRSC